MIFPQTATAMVRVRLQNVSKRFASGVDALRNVSVDVEDGKLYTLVGPSGSGKSTLLHLIAGIEAPSSGSIYFDDVLANGQPPRLREVALVFQDGVLYPHLSVRENLAFGLRLRGLPSHELENRTRAAARDLVVEHLLDRSPSTLSGGERQRVALGKALVCRPRILLLDEPLTSIDSELRHELRDLLRALRLEHPVTTMFVTHDSEEALSLGDRVVVLHEGRVQQVDSPARIYDSPVNLLVARTIGARPINVFAGRLAAVDGSVIFRGDGLEVELAMEQQRRVASSIGGDVSLAVRPEHLNVLATGQLPQDRGASRAPVECRVRLVEPIGAGADVHLVAESGTEFVTRLHSDVSYLPGEPVRIDIDPSRVLLFDADGRSILQHDASSEPA